MANASDDFAGTGLISGNWTLVGGLIARVSGEAVATDDESTYTWNANVWSANTKSSIVIGATFNDNIYTYLRWVDGSNHYFLQAEPTQVRMRKAVAGVNSTLRTVTQTVSPGEKWSLGASGTTLQLYLNDVATGASVSDSEFTSAGLSGIGIDAAGDSIAGWFGDDAPAGKMLNSVQVGTQVGTSPINGPILGLNIHA